MQNGNNTGGKRYQIYISRTNSCSKKASLVAFKGKTTIVIGPNGSGKTTLLLVPAGLIKPENGTVLYKGRDIFSQLSTARKEIGIVFQDPDDQLFNTTVFDEIAFGLKQLDLQKEEIEKRVLEISERLKIKHLLDRSPFLLSFGEKKIVALAAILVVDPELLILDEPTGNLSREYKEIIKQIIAEYKAQGKSVIIATHDIIFATEILDYICILNNGETIEIGTKHEVLKDPQKLTKAGIDHPYIILEKLKRILT